MPVAPIHHHLNLTGQNILTDASWALTAILAGVAILLWRRERGVPFYLLMILAAMVAALAEPLYDVGFGLYFYSTHGMQRSFTAFGVPQPIWAYSGYAVLYAAPAIYINRRIQQGQFIRSSVVPVAVAIFVMSCVFEVTGINMGTYTYFGAHVLRIFKYPVVIAVLETAQVICFATACSLLRRYATSAWHLLGVFAIFPLTFFGANFGAGSAVIIAIHAQHSPRWLVYVCTIVSIGAALALIRMAAAFLPQTRTPLTTATAAVDKAPTPAPAELTPAGAGAPAAA